MLQILNERSELVGELPKLSNEQLVDVYKNMVLARTLDRKLAAMNLQGRIASYYKIEGQEAHVGAAMAMEENDWLYPAYREMGMWLVRGMPPEIVVRRPMGVKDSKWDADKYRISMLCATIGTQLPHAVGHAYGARELGRTDEVVVTVLGDGATSTPDFHAAMNFAGVWKTPTVFLCQNNQWAEETPLSKQTASETIAQKAQAYGFEGIRVDGQDVLAVYAAMKVAVDRARAGDGPTLIEMLTYRYSPHMVSAIDPRPEEEKEYWYARDPLSRLEQFLRNQGLLGEDLSEQIRAEAAARVEAAVDTVTSEVSAEGEVGTDYMVRNVYQGVPPHLVEQLNTWERWSGKPETTFSADELWAPGEEVIPQGVEAQNWCMREAINAALHHGMETRPETIVLGEDVAMVGGEFRVTAGLLDKYGEGRVIDTPLCELGIIGSAVGMAAAGARTVTEIMFAGFTYTALDNIFGHVSRWRFRYQGKKTMPMVIRMGYGSGVGGAEFHIDSPENYFLQTPGLIVVMPSTPVEAKGLMAAALESEDPVIFFEPMLMYNTPREEVPQEHYTIPLGRARIRQEGADVTLVTYGNMVEHALRAAKQSAASVEVIDLRTIKPWDRETVLQSVEKTGRLVVVHESPDSAGIGSEIAAAAARKCLYALQAPPVVVAGLDAPRPTRHLEKLANITAMQIQGAIQQVLSA